jgi:tetratricopeptide (TPR) repeat protein
VSNIRTASTSTLLKAAAIILVGAWIYWPAIHGGWIWDDGAEIAHNPVIRDPEGLAKIWVSPATPDYFPLKTTLQWFLWRIWGENTEAYHLLTLGLHLADALLFWRLLKRLGLRFAWLGGLLFVVHPIVVESVAWIAELKNTLSLAFLLAAMIAYVDYDDESSASSAAKSSRAQAAYLRSLLLFLLAVLSKSSVVMFPFVLLLYAWWKRTRISKSDLVGSIPFFAVSLILGIVTISFQQHRALASWTIPLGGWDSRIACAGVALAFYVWKCALPFDLLPMYPQWSVAPPSLLQFAPWFVVALLLGWFWTRRATWGRHLLFGVGFFILNLLPVLGFVSMAYMHIAWVADHFVYLPVLGLIGVAVAGAGRLADRIDSRPPSLRLFAIGTVSVLLGALAWQSRTHAARYGDEEALWTYTLNKNPGAWMAHINLGQFFGQTGRSDIALEQYSDALRIRPDLPEAYYNRGSTLAQMGRVPEAIGDFDQALRLQPDSVDVHINLGNALARSGRMREAINHYEEALRIQPDAVDARNYLAEAHFEMADALVQRRQYAEAVDEYRQSLLLRPDSAPAHAHLGYVLAGMHQLPDAIAQFEEALRLQPDDVRTRENLALLQRIANGGGP